MPDPNIESAPAPYTNGGSFLTQPVHALGGQVQSMLQNIHTIDFASQLPTGLGLESLLHGEPSDAAHDSAANVIEALPVDDSGTDVDSYTVQAFHVDTDNGGIDVIVVQPDHDSNHEVVADHAQDTSGDHAVGDAAYAQTWDHSADA